MNQLLDFTQPVKVDLLDMVVSTMIAGNVQEQQEAAKVLAAFQQHEDAWKRVPTIVNESKNSHTKFLALQILDQAVRFKWKVLPQNQQLGMKNFVIRTVIELSRENAEKDKLLIRKFDEVLVQILKHEWPHNWPNFISEIIDSSKLSESLCENNMNILKLLSEEVFEFNSGKMVQQKTEELKQAYNKEFMKIFQLGEFILQKATSQSLCTTTLQTMLGFLKWIPFGYIFETSLIPTLISKFLPIYAFRNDTLRCLIEVADMKESRYDESFQNLYFETLKVVSNLLPLSKVSIPQGYATGNRYDQQFIQLLGIFFTTVFKNHLPVIEQANQFNSVILGHVYLIEISKCEDRELFKTNLIYWTYLTKSLCEEIQRGKHNNGPFLIIAEKTQRGMTYSNILTQLRCVMVSKMAKPEEVIIVEDENGNIVKQFYTDVDSIELYKSMATVLIALTHLDHDDMETIMVNKLRNFLRDKQFRWKDLNTLCWAIGSISGAMEEEHEKNFLVTVIRDLLHLVDMKTGKQNKAVVASNIMYVVGQYPRFLRAHWRFLKTVIKKLFEFMHEEFQGVQEMACDTFVKITKQCRQQFVLLQQEEQYPFIQYVLNNIHDFTKKLEPQHVNVFYEAVGYMIEASDHMKPNYLNSLMNSPNQRWKEIIRMASADVNNINNTEVMRMITQLLQINVAVAKSSGACFIYQIKLIYQDMFEIYKIYAQLISQEISRLGEIAARHANVKAMRSVKSEILNLVEMFISNSTDTNIITKHFMPPLLNAVLVDYNKSVPDAKDPTVLSVLAATIRKLKDYMLEYLPEVLKSVLETTLPMISQNFSDFPDHRRNLFVLLREINRNCFQTFFKISEQGFKLVIDSMMWAIRHNHRASYETGLLMLQELLLNLQSSQSNPKLLFSFYQTYFERITNDVFVVLTDTMHLSGFLTQGFIIYTIFAAVCRINEPIFPKTKQFPSNQEYVKAFVSELLCKSFPNMKPQTVSEYVNRMMKSGEKDLFIGCLKDFVVSCREWTNEQLVKMNNSEKL